LRTIHRRFGHPTVRRLELLLERAGHDVDSDALLAITKVCEHCQKHGGPPGRFKFTLKDDVSFNHTIIIDIVDLRGRKAIQVVDEATSFNSARFVKSMSAVHAWEALRACWIDVYQGPPDFIVHDPGTNFHSKEFRDYAKSMGSATRTMPIESHNSIGKVERYHIPLRRAYNIMCDEMANLSDAERLQMAVKAVNDTAGPNGLIPTLLVFGAYPRIAENSAPSPTVTERAGAIKKAMNEVRKCHALRQVTEALRTRNGPRTTPIHDLPLNSEVMVWREHKGWEGPFTLLGMDGESCLIGFPNAPPRAFRSTKIKPFLRASDDLQILKEDLPGDGKSTSLTGPAANTRSRTVANREEELEILMTTTEDNQEAFEAWLTEKEIRDAQISIDLREKGIIKTPGKSFELSRRTEIDGLLARGVFKMINENDPSIGKERIFGSRLVDEVKGKETPVPYEKSRLVIQAYNDKGKKDILTQSPTIQRVSQRILVALAATLIEQGLKLCLRDITQAYVQSLTKLRRKVYARPPKEMVDELPKGTIFEVILPLYGIPEAGNHWFNTYYKHHLHNLIMETSTYDPCLLITKESEPALGIVGMQTDDTLILGEPDFLAKEDVELKAAKLLAKDTETLSTRNSLMFNGCIITQEKHSLAIAQKGQGKRIEAINTKSSDFRQAFMEQRARGAYIAAICQPEATYDTAVAAQQHEPLLEDVKLLNKRLLWQKGKLSRGIRYVPLDLSTAKLYVFVDASFANNKDLSSQIGYVIVLGNEAAGKGEFQLTGNIIHWSSTKCKRVTRAVLASELYAMAAGVDIAISISTTLAMIAHRLKLSNIPTILCTDSFSLYECIVKLGTTKEKRLMIDIMAIRQSYERRELSEVRWVEGNSNPADAMTKANPNKALEQLIDNNQLTVKIDGWIERPQQEA
jgi:hypothetical protein